MNQLKLISKLLRAEQWYKNSVVFIALLFSGNLFDKELFLITLLAFVALCLVSSANYIINDLRDKDKDRLHKIKKFRPIAAKLISEKFAKFWIAGLLIFGFGLSYILNLYFCVMIVFLFLLMQTYTYWLKHYLYLDVFMISVFFVLRAVLGAFAIMGWISPWLIICPFFLARFLAANKRYADLAMDSKKAVKTRSVLKKYSLSKAKRLVNIGAVMLIFSFTIYSLQKNLYFLLSVPVAAAALWRYMQLVFSNYKIGIQSELALRDWKLLILSVIWAAIIGIVLYI